MIVIHIGLRKAASSSLQSFLKDNENRLRRKLSIDYTRIGRVERMAHHSIANEIRGRSQFRPGCGTLSQLSAYWRNAPSTVMALSSEVFEDAESDHIRALKTALLQGRDDEQFQIYLILRDLVDLMPSSYSQKVKYGKKAHSFDVFFEQRVLERRVNYFETAALWADVFGWESMRVRVLGAESMLNGDPRDDFMAVCGAKPDQLDDQFLKRERASNTAPGWKVNEAMRALAIGRHGLPDDHPLLVHIGRVGDELMAKCATNTGERLGWNKDRGRYLTRKQIGQCLDIYASAIRSLNERLREQLPEPPGIEARDFVDRDFMPSQRHINKEELSLFYVELLAMLDSKAKLRDGLERAQDVGGGAPFRLKGPTGSRRAAKPEAMIAADPLSSSAKFVDYGRMADLPRKRHRHD